MPSDESSSFQTPQKTERLRRTPHAPGSSSSSQKKKSTKPFQFAPSSPFYAEVNLNGSSSSSPPPADDIITPRRLLHQSSVPDDTPPNHVSGNSNININSSSSNNNNNKPSRTVYLIRHGQSQGQVSKNRQTDPSLTDCGLTETGREQARNIVHWFPTRADYERIDWVLSSPLTRAIETAVLAFPNNRPILCHYDLREIGNTTIPENIPRRTRDVVAYLQQQAQQAQQAQAQLYDCSSLNQNNDDAASCKSNNDDDSSFVDNNNAAIMMNTTIDNPPAKKKQSNSSTTSTRTTSPVLFSATRRIDFISLRPDSWPRYHDTPPKVIRRDRVRQEVFEWLAQIVPDHVRDIAIVCHYHVIRSALTSSSSSSAATTTKSDHSNNSGSHHHHQAYVNYIHQHVCPRNAQPIACELTADGKLRLKRE